MNRFFTFSIVGLLTMMGCHKEDPVVALEAVGFDKKTVLITPNSRWAVKINQRVVAKTTGGSIRQTPDDSLIFTAPTTPGKQKIVVKSEKNSQDSLIINVAVTSKANIFRALQAGGFVIIFRHASADVGSDQLTSTVPEWWKSCNKDLARQLNETGRQEAIGIGQTFKNLQIPVARMISSEFCRCFTTADLMNAGVPTQLSKDVTFYVYDEANRYANTMKIAQNQPIDTQNTVMVIHSGFLGAMPTPAPLSSLNWGDAAVFELVSGQAPRYVATLFVKEWLELAK